MDSQESADGPVSPEDTPCLHPRQHGGSDQRSAIIDPSRASHITGHGRSEAKTTTQTASAHPDVCSVPAARGGQTGRKDLSAGLQLKRTSMKSTSVSGRAPMATRSHVPSLMSDAFFRPMSSQTLQAQRGAGSNKLAPVNRQLQTPPANLDDDQTDMGGSVIDGMSGDNLQHTTADHSKLSETGDNMRPPPSRGTEMTDQETFGHMSDSGRPLQKQSDQGQYLHIKLDRSYRNLAGLPSPAKSTKSFRSSFLLPSKVGQAQSGRQRSTNGAEKLPSAASSPLFAGIESKSGPKPLASISKGQRIGRVYQYFEGNTVFCIGGRWQNTKHTPVNIATALFVVVPCALFLGFEAPWLWENVSPAIPITFAYLAYICMSSFIHASVSDPGILPRNLHRFPQRTYQDDPLRMDPPTNDWTLIKSAEPTAAAMEFPIKHCQTCNIWRQPRAHHCRLCDNCVEGHDHHCVWLNNCVGKRNYRFFFTFVTSGTILSAYLIGASLTKILIHMNREELSFGESANDFRVTLALVIIGALCITYPAGLVGYHLFLMSRGETTREYIVSHKFARNERFRPFSQGNWFKNLIAVLCRPSPPTYYRFKSGYKTGDQRLGVHHSQRPRHNSQGLELDSVLPGTSTSTGFQGPVALRGQICD